MKSYVYFIGSVNEQNGALEAIKIGKANDPLKRLTQLQKPTGVYQTFVILYYMECRDEKHAFEVEKGYQDTFSEDQIDKEWFRVTASLLSFICRELAETDFPIASNIGMRT